MRLIIFVLILLNLNVSLFAQENKLFKCTIGNSYTLADVSNNSYLMKSASKKNAINAGKSLLTVVIEDDHLYISKLSADNLSVESFKDYTMPKKSKLEKFDKIGSHYYVFYSVIDKNTSNEQLLYNEIDPNTGLLKNEKESILLSNGEKVYEEIPYDWTTPKYLFRSSFDSTKRLIYYRLKVESKTENIKHLIGFAVYDAQLNQIWKKEIKMPYSETKMRILDYAVNDEGTVFLLTLVYNTTITKEIKADKKSPNYHIEILTINDKMAELKKTQINVDNKFIYKESTAKKMKLLPSFDNSIICAGFYFGVENIGDYEIREDTKGILLYRINSTGDLLNRFSSEIPLEIMNQNETEGNKKQNIKNNSQGELSFLRLALQQILVQKDGSCIIIGEKIWDTSLGHSSTSNYNNIFIAKVSKVDKVEWMKLLPKQQATSCGRDYRLSFKYHNDIENNKHVLFFFDNIENKDITIDDVPKMYQDNKKGYLTAFIVDDLTGNVQKNYLLNTETIKAKGLSRFGVDKLFDIGKNDVLFDAMTEKSNILIKIQLLKE